MLVYNFAILYGWMSIFPRDITFFYELMIEEQKRADTGAQYLLVFAVTLHIHDVHNEPQVCY